MPAIRPPSEKLGNLPSAWKPPDKDEPVEGVKEAKTNTEVFIACLRHMTEETRKKKRFKTRITLLNGRRVDIHRNTYAFALDAEEDVFEDPGVDVHINGIHVPGSIVSITASLPRTLLLALGQDFGESIEECHLQQDNISFLEKLLARYEVETGAKSHGSLRKVEADFSFADRVLLNKPKMLSHKVTIDPGDLNSDQHSFVATALSRDIAYLWGPPGTGKTKCLGALVSGLYEEEERSAIVSNTNKAVDQVLLKLCRDLVSRGRKKDLEDGRIIRLGIMHNEELETEFGEYLNIDRIVEAKGEEFEQEALRLRAQLKADADEVETLNEILTLIENLSGIQKEADFRLRQFSQANQEYKNAEFQLNKNLAKQEQLKRKKQSVGTRGFLGELFGQTSEQIDSKLVTCAEAESLLENRVERARETLDKTTNLKDKAVGVLSKVKSETRDMSPSDVHAELAKIRKRIKEDEATLALVTKKLDSLRKNLISEALVVGSTLAQVYLISELLGKCDNLIVDEASMAILPELYFAAALAKKRVVISGDFRQLPPIINSDNKTIKHHIGRNIFQVSGVGRRLFEGQKVSNAVMLSWQYRMPDMLCNQVSKFAYNSKLKTAPGFSLDEKPAPKGYQAPLTVIDTSGIRPFSTIEATGSRSNTIHAIIAKRLLREFASSDSYGSVGYIAPFKSQSELVKSMVKAGGFDDKVAAGTIHVFQGDEKDTIVLDTVDALGMDANLGIAISQDKPYEAQAMTVAMSRPRQRLIIVANLSVLDQKLPAQAFLRGILAEAESSGAVIKAEQVFEIKKIGKTVKAELLERHNELKKIKAEYQAKSNEVKKAEVDLRRMRKSAQEDIQERSSAVAETEKLLGQRSKEIEQIERDLVDKANEVERREIELQLAEENSKERVVKGDEFDDWFVSDLGNAVKSLVIYSGYFRTARIQKLINVFRAANNRGLKMRAIIPPPEANGTARPEEGRHAIGLLKECGFVVDMRASIHEKAIIIDESTIYNGSLNPLSFAGTTSETMIRSASSAHLCLSFWEKNSAYNLSLNKERANFTAKENPDCKSCGGETIYHKSQKARWFKCTECTDEIYIEGKKPMNTGATRKCEWCGGNMVKKPSKYGKPFWGCEHYPNTGCEFKIFD